MPDFERLADKLMRDLAETPEQVAYAEGYIAGKKQARKEVAIVVAFVPGVVLLVVLFVAAQRFFS